MHYIDANPRSMHAKHPQDTTKSLETGQSATVGPADSTLSDDAGGYGIWEDMANPRHSNIGISILPMPLNIPSTWRADAATAPSAANGGSAAAAATAAAATAADDGGDYGAGDDDDDDAGTVTSSVGLLCGGAVVRVKLRLRRVGVLQAAQERLGLPEAAARSCIAMLSAPGGLFLDVKSAYSKPRDLEQFCASLAGVGIHVKVGSLSRHLVTIDACNAWSMRHVSLHWSCLLEWMPTEVSQQV